MGEECGGHAGRVTVDGHAEMFGQGGEQVDLARWSGLLQRDQIRGTVGNDVRHPGRVDVTVGTPAELDVISHDPGGVHSR